MSRPASVPLSSRWSMWPPGAHGSTRTAYRRRRRTPFEETPPSRRRPARPERRLGAARRSRARRAPRLVSRSRRAVAPPNGRARLRGGRCSNATARRCRPRRSDRLEMSLGRRFKSFVRLPSGKDRRVHQAIGCKTDAAAYRLAIATGADSTSLRTRCPVSIATWLSKEARIPLFFCRAQPHPPDRSPRPRRQSRQRAGVRGRGLRDAGSRRSGGRSRSADSAGREPPSSGRRDPR